MNPKRLSVLCAAVVVLVGCNNDTAVSPTSGVTGGTTQTSPGLVSFGTVAHPETGSFVAVLSGEDAGADTRARGTATFRVVGNGTAVEYRLIVANIENLRMAHIHIAPVGSDGPIAVWLYPDGPPAVPIPGRFNGVLAEGTIADENLTGPLAGMTVADLVEKITSGMTYVNVHTDQYPPGEIRGQISSH